MGPTDNRKPFEQWSFEDMKHYGVWCVIASMSQGHTLASAVHEILNIALQWQAAQQEKKNAK